MEPSTAAASSHEMLAQMAPLVLISVTLSIIIYFAARKRGVFPWGWIVLTMVPFIGILVAAIFFLFTFFSTLDRLNALEASLSRKTKT